MWVIEDCGQFIAIDTAELQAPPGTIRVLYGENMDRFCRSARNSYDGETELNYSGRKPPYGHLDVEQSHSWMKSPRWKGKPMEVGPLTRVLYAKGHEQTKERVDYTLKTLDLPQPARCKTSTNCMTPGSPSRSWVPSTTSPPASPARYMSPIWMARSLSR